MWQVVYTRGGWTRPWFDEEEEDAMKQLVGGWAIGEARSRKLELEGWSWKAGRLEGWKAGEGWSWKAGAGRLELKGWSWKLEG